MIEGDFSVQKLKERFPQAIAAIEQFRGETTITVRASQILPVCQYLRDDGDSYFEMLIDLCGRPKRQKEGILAGANIFK